MSNGFEGAERWVKEIERHHETLATYQGEYMARCRTVRESISGCFDAAKDAGIPVKELRAVITERKLLRKIEGIREKLDEEQVETFDQIKHALGMLDGLPLGDAALKRSNAIDSLTDDDGEDADAVAGRKNAEALGAGIQQKH
ncbi:hypothetical protein [Bosea sp. TAF32]|uniref:hypothetical protein n=1 Tax=Bosea sp. TAF32 TaxID=3237482 RepID=UPI003F914E63